MIARFLVWPLVLLASSASAAERGFTVIDFDRIQVDGPYVVRVETGKGPSARATGPGAALDQLRVEVRGRTLIVTRQRSQWGERFKHEPGSVSVRVTVPQLIRADLSGSGTLAIDRLRGPRLSLVVAGDGNLSAGAIDTDRLDLTLAGNGSITAGGKALVGSVTARGNGLIDASGLEIADLTLNASGAGSSRVAARRAAKVVATGSANVTILGTPACTVNALGSGEVSCGTPKS